METKWVNPLTENTNIIETCFSESHGSLITRLNVEPQIDYQSASGAKDFVRKNHLNAR